MRLRVNGDPPASQNMGDPSLDSGNSDTDKVIIHIAEPNSQEIEAIPQSTQAKIEAELVNRLWVDAKAEDEAAKNGASLVE